MSYSVYIILCDDKSFYTGYTENLNRRIKLHEAGKGARYTKMHRPKKLVYVEKFNSRKDAMRRERKIKRLNHHQKAQLIKSNAKL